MHLKFPNDLLLLYFFTKSGNFVQSMPKFFWHDNILSQKFINSSQFVLSFGFDKKFKTCTLFYYISYYIK
jgi:hypothetical protein